MAIAELDLERLNSLVPTIQLLSQRLRLAHHSRPMNLDDARKEVLESIGRGQVVNPELAYPVEESDLRAIALDALRATEAGATEWDVLVHKEITRQLTASTAMRSHSHERITEETADRFGRPSEDLLLTAKRILDEVPAYTSDAPHAASATKERVEAALGTGGFDGWRVVASKSMQAKMAVRSRDRRIRISSHATFSDAEIDRLIAHEIGTHVLRYEQGLRQPLSLLAIPLGVAEPTEEGLAVFNEARMGLLQDADLRKYALRVVAADVALRGSFSEVVEALLPHTDAGAAVDIAIRAKRGFRHVDQPGAHLKDIAYLKGYLEMVRRQRRDPEAYDLLMSVKQPAANLPLVRELWEDGQLLRWPLARGEQDERLPGPDRVWRHPDGDAHALCDKPSRHPTGRANAPAAGIDRGMDIALRALTSAESRLFRVDRYEDREISGDVDFNDTDCSFGIEFVRCRFTGSFTARNARLRSVRFVDCEIDGLDLASAVVGGDLLVESTTVRTSIDLTQATVEGLVSFLPSPSGGSSTSVIATGRSTAVDAKNAHFKGDILASDAKFLGTLSFDRARIAGRLNLKNAEIDGTDAELTSGASEIVALSATRASIEGGLLLRDAQLLGQFRAIGLQLDAQLNLAGARVRHANNKAIVLQRADLASSLLARGAHISGMIDMEGAQVHGDLYFQGLRVDAPRERVAISLKKAECGHIDLRGSRRERPDLPVDGDPAVDSPEQLGDRHAAVLEGTLELRSTTVYGDVWLSGLTIDSAESCVDATSAAVRGRLEARQAKFTSGSGVAIVATALQTGSRVDIGLGQDDSTSANLRGTCDFTNARIGTSLSLCRATVTARGVALLVKGASIGSKLDLSDAVFEAEDAGHLAWALDGEDADVGADLCIGGRDQPTDLGGGCRLIGARIAQDAEFRGLAFSSDSVVDLTRCSIGGQLSWRDIESAPAELILNSATVKELDDESGSWPSDGGLDLHGFTFEQFSAEARKVDVTERLGWLALQERFSADPYERLAGLYRAQSNDQAARTVMLGLHRQQILKRGSIRERLPRWVWFGLTGYGYRLTGIVVAALLVLTTSIGSAYWARADQLVIPSEVGSIAQVGECTPGYPCFDPVVYGVDVVVPVLELHQSRFWSPDRSTESGAVYDKVVQALTLFGWVSLSVIAAGLAQRIRS